MPGVILAVVVGGSAAIAAVAGLRGRRLFPHTSLLAGMVLLGWVVGEILMLPLEMRSSMEARYLGAGVLMAALGVLLWAWDARRCSVDANCLEGAHVEDVAMTVSGKQTA